MKKETLNLSLLGIFIFSVTLNLIPLYDSSAFSVVRKPKAIECGTCFGTSCEGEGDGCDPYSCADLCGQNY